MIITHKTIPHRFLEKCQTQNFSTGSNFFLLAKEIIYLTQVIYCLNVGGKRRGNKVKGRRGRGERRREGESRREDREILW